MKKITKNLTIKRLSNIAYITSTKFHPIVFNTDYNLQKC